MTAPIISGPSSAAAPVEISTTSTTVGASLSPDSASSEPVSRLGSGTTRSTEKTAAASVAEVTAPSRIAISHGRPSRKWPASATMDTDTENPIVASATPSRIAGRISAQVVVSPPSARISTSAANPRACASSAFSKGTPSSDSPRTTPISR